jgi:hypothetical protein
LRSEAGGQNDIEAPSTSTQVTDDAYGPDASYNNNSHWLNKEEEGGGGGEGQASNFVAYYDAASLYPSSGKSASKILFFRRQSRRLGKEKGGGKGKEKPPQKPTQSTKTPSPLPFPSPPPSPLFFAKINLPPAKPAAGWIFDLTFFSIEFVSLFGFFRTYRHALRHRLFVCLNI